MQVPAPHDDDPWRAFANRRIFPCLDGLRCLSILAVIAFHTFGHETGFRLVAHGHLGVELFFAISGFLITTLLVRERDASGGISLRKFYLRRSLRIFPLYFAVLAVYVLLVAFVERDPVTKTSFFGNLPFFATYTSNWFVPLDQGDRVIFYFAWSLATEEQFYLVWPLALGLLRGTLAPLVFMAALFAFDQVAEGMAAHGGLEAGAITTRMATSIATPICLGSILALLFARERTFRALHPVLGGRASALVIFALLVAAIFWPAAPALLIHVLMALLVGASVLGAHHWLAPLLENPVARYLGKVSYGLYLLHMLALNVTKRALPSLTGAPRFAVTLALATVAAGLSYRFFEGPILRFKERFARPTA